MKYFNNCTTIEEAKKLYKTLAKENHPDRGGNTETMQEINREFQFAIAKLAKGENLSAADVENEIKLSKAYQDAINSIISLDGINIEVVGSWIWVTGKTYPVKDTLKNARFMFAPKKSAWFFRTDDNKVNTYGKTMTLDDIRKKYGTQNIHTKNFTYLHN